MSKRKKAPKGSGSVCVRKLNGNIVRIKKDKAELLVASGRGEYCSKTEWREEGSNG